MFIARLRLLVIVMTLLTVYGVVCGQDKVRVKINLNGIEKEKLNVEFDDGIVSNIINLDQGDSTIIVEKPIYTAYPSLTVVYDRRYHKNYFIDSSAATLNLFYDANRNNDQLYTSNNSNITTIYDTVSNEVYRNLKRRQITELQELNDLFAKHGQEVHDNDSIKYELVSIVKAINTSSMEFLIPYSRDFFSFYYFKDQVLGLTRFIETDSEYYIKLLAYYNNTFPKEFRSTGEGKKIAAQLQQKISPVLLKENETLPDTHFRDIYGDTIVFKEQKEEFILVDFWASWCVPCVQQIPDIKLLREQFSEDKLKIVSISNDRDSISFINSIEEHHMDWTHSLDRGGLLSDALGVSSIPTVMLLDRNARIIYYKNGGDLDMEKIRAIIRED